MSISANELYSEFGNYTTNVMNRAVEKVITQVKTELKEKVEAWKKDTKTVNTDFPRKIDVYLSNVTKNVTEVAAKQLCEEGFAATAHEDDNRDTTYHWISIKTIK